MNLDAQTLYLFNAMGLCVIALLVAIAAASYPQQLRHSGLLWAAATLAQSLGMAAIGLRGLIPDAASVITAHVLGIGGLAGFHHALARFRGAKTPGVLYYLAVPVALASSIYYFWLGPNYPMRVAIFSLLAALELVLCAVASWKARSAGAPWTSVAAGVGFALAACLLAPRVWLSTTLDSAAPPDTILVQSGTERVIILSLMLLFFFLAFSFVMLCNERINHELKRLAHRDSLTGSRNRRGILASGQREVARARRSGRPLTLALVDVDRLKQINDRLGHAAGDRAIVHVAQCLDADLRKVDVAGRWGGDEFLLVLPDTEEDGARRVCERVRADVMGTPLEFSEGDWVPSVTIGVATGRGADLDFDDLIAEADGALYEAKELGRNRVVVSQVGRSEVGVSSGPVEEDTPARPASQPSG